MVIALESVVVGKHYDTEIDTITFMFETTGQTYVDEFDVPEGYKYVIYLCESDKKDLSYIEIVNPVAIIEDENTPLPKIDLIIYEGKEYELRELIKLVFENMNN